MLLQDYSLELDEIDGLKLGLLIGELDSFIKKEYADIQALDPKEE